MKKAKPAYEERNDEVRAQSVKDKGPERASLRVQNFARNVGPQELYPKTLLQICTCLKTC